MTEHTPGRVGRPPKVNREQVVAAAADILTNEGPLKFSMRTLAARLDISAMGIYHYFDSKNDLLGAVLEHQAWNTPAPELSEDPRVRLGQLPLAVIDHLVRHPWVIDVLSADEIIDGYAAWSFDEFLKTADELGIPEPDSMQLLLGLWRIVVGEVVVRTNLDTRRERGAKAWFEREIPEHVLARPRLMAMLECLEPGHESDGPNLESYDTLEAYDIKRTVDDYIAGALGER